MKTKILLLFCASVLIVCFGLLMLRFKAVSHSGVAAYKKGNYEKALAELTPLAQRGNAQAQYYLGSMYFSGLGVAEDHREASKWYVNASEQGLVNAQLALGIMYAIGDGIPEDYQQASKWLRKPAEKGDRRAQYYLGRFYFQGRGVSKNYEEARKWYLKAAEQGHVDALYSLATMYANAEGVRKDKVKAYMWASLAAAKGYAHGVLLREQLGENMIPQQIAQAKQLVDEWRKTHKGVVGDNSTR